MGSEVKVYFVCIKAAHHRRAVTSGRVCEHLGCAAYCPAGDVEGHEWMVTSTDLGTLTRLGHDGERKGPSGKADKKLEAADKRHVRVGA